MVPPFAYERFDLDCCIVADDLTGSCDAAVHFARRGMAVAVAISGEVGPRLGVQVVAVNIDSRCVEERVAVERVRAAFHATAGIGAVLFKKIDSSLRGHVAAEIGAAIETSGCDLVLIAPALPALGRTVARGCVVLPSGEEIDLAEALSPLPLRMISAHEFKRFDLVLAAMRDRQERGTKIFCFDADSDASLDQIVDLGRATGQRVLWVGAAGLAAALARAIAPLTAKRVEELREVNGPVLFGIGSNRSATLAQVAKLRENANVFECSPDALRIDDVRGAVRAGRNVLLHLPPCGIDAAKIVEFAQGSPLSGFGGVVLTGGDTASAFLKAVGAHTLEVRAEVMPGIPVSLIRGGVAEGMSVITKSGAFGDEDAFLRCIDFFPGAGKVVEEGRRQ